MSDRPKFGLGGGISLDQMVARGIGVILTKDDYHSVSRAAIRENPNLHEHAVEAIIWWVDDNDRQFRLGDPDTLVAIQKALAAQSFQATYGMTLDELLPDKEEPVKWQWLASTKDLQENTYGYDYDQMPTQDRARYIDWNVSAAIQEMAEVREEFSWKPWAVDLPFINRDRVRDEVIDALHFLGNILTAIGVSDAELQSYYMLKQQKNRARQASGTYSAKKGGIGEGSDI